MIELQDHDIRCIEKQILKVYNGHWGDYPQCGCLLKLRKNIINHRALKHQAEILPDIMAFNDALTTALREMYDRAHRICNEMNALTNATEQMVLTAKCYLGNYYPALHPVQGEDRQELWCALCDSGWNRLYDDGVTLQTLALPHDMCSFESLIGMDSPPPNWNEGLDPYLTKDLHLTSAFHHLFDHTMFAITDFIYVRHFETEINIEIRKSEGAVQSPFEKN